jgi:hypothetical protein
MKKDYIPSAASDLYSWETNFTGNVAPIAQTLGIALPDINTVTDLVNGHQKDYNNNVTAQKAALSATATLKDSHSTTIAAIRKFAGRLKAAPGYTEDMGKTLGIIGADSTFDKGAAKPTLKLSVQGGNVIVAFDNPHEVDGVQIFSKRAAETVFTLLAVDTSSPYEDNRANATPGTAEERSYYAYYFEDASIIGRQSDVVSVSITK